MKGKTKRKFTADFKLKVVLEVLKEKDTLATISKRYELHRSGSTYPSGLAHQIRFINDFGGGPKPGFGSRFLTPYRSRIWIG